MSTAGSCTILLSRQPLRPCASTAWVSAMVRAVEWAVAQGLTINSSVGCITWDLLTVASARCGAQLRIFLPVAHGQRVDELRRRTIHDYELDPERCTWQTVEAAEQDKQTLMEMRDRTMVAAADLLVPVCLRTGGFFHTLVSQWSGPIVDSFAIPYRVREDTLAYELKPEDISDEAQSVGHRYLVHWTRTARTRWPGETTASFCRALLDSPTYPRDAFATLRNILSTRRIAASPRHMPGSVACVSLTGTSPAEFIRLMRWRARYREMSFEPYGVGIERSSALAAGVRPVRYCRQANDATDVPRWLRQGSGRITRWCDEDEYRWKGDLTLTQFDPGELVCFCRRAHEAQRINREFGLHAIPVTREP